MNIEHQRRRRVSLETGTVRLCILRMLMPSEITELDATRIIFHALGCYQTITVLQNAPKIGMKSTHLFTWDDVRR